MPREKLVTHIKKLLEKLQEKQPGAKFFGVEKVERSSVDAEVPKDVLPQGGWRRMKPTMKKRIMFLKERQKGWRCLGTR